MSDQHSVTTERVSHTPGPWSVEAVVGDDPHDICGPDRPGEGSPNLLASVAYDEDDPLPHISLVEANANARLIAAAPELLAACKAMMPDGWDEGHMDHMPGIKAARLAIAKAEGRS